MRNQRRRKEVLSIGGVLMAETGGGASVEDKSFLILHGWQNRRPEEHWQYKLASALTGRGYRVRYPQLPDPDEPVLKDWLAAIEQELHEAGSANVVVIAHSLACAAWLHLAQSGSVHLPVARLLFVAPPSPEFLAAEPAIAEFVPPQAGLGAIGATSATKPRLACAQGDPTCSPSADQVYPGVFDVDLIPHGGHLDMPAGYGEWPSILDWCEHPDRRLTANN
jgi:predicted alpha/beta hydrolase family esterase